MKSISWNNQLSVIRPPDLWPTLCSLRPYVLLQACYRLVKRACKWLNQGVAPVSDSVRPVRGYYRFLQVTVS